jgi:hypothetical protein
LPVPIVPVGTGSVVCVPPLVVAVALILVTELSVFWKTATRV